MMERKSKEDDERGKEKRKREHGKGRRTDKEEKRWFGEEWKERIGRRKGFISSEDNEEDIG